MNFETEFRRVDRRKPLACHQQIHQAIVRAIEEEELEAGARIPAERKLAELCGVSRTTVRLAMESLVHQGYVEKHAGSGIFVAFQPTRRRVGCMLPALNPYGRYQWHVLLAQSILREVRSRGYEDVVYLMDSAEDYAHLERDIGRGWIDGLLSVSLLEPMSHSLPVVYVNLKTDGFCVSIDYPRMVRQGVEFLAARGRRKIALFTYESRGEDAGQTEQTFRGRTEQAFRQILRECDLPFREEWVVEVENLRDKGRREEEGGKQALLRLWQSRQRPDAILFIDDWHGLGGMQALMELGVEVPDQVMIATHVNQGYDLPFPCPTAKLQIDPRELARNMVDLLQEIWDGKIEPREALVAPVLSPS
jgi:DNA-binding LacI/PurR family transcriptional regulator